MCKRAIDEGITGLELDERGAKRRKLPIHENTDLCTSETVESTSQHGFELLDILKRTTDKNGRLVATDFLTLPSRKLFPDYYDVTKIPIALDTIESKLKSRDFKNLSSLENYFKRMVLNAKEYNEKGSIIHEDSERLRKTVSNYMNKHNPVYNQVPIPAALVPPIPGENCEINPNLREGQEQDEKSNKKSHRSIKNLQPARHSTLTLTRPRSSGSMFEGLTFQQAQERIIDDIISKRGSEENDPVTFEPFITLPSRKEYKDYYNIITHPVALKDLQRAVRGIRLKTPGISEFKTWSAFEGEASYIWKNAFLYNEDNSEIFKLAREMQLYFNKLLNKAKAVVPEPVSTKIKLRMHEPTKITLKLGRRTSPVEATVTRPPTQLPTSQASLKSSPHSVYEAGPSSSQTCQPKPGQNIPISAACPTHPPASTLVKNEENSRNLQTLPQDRALSTPIPVKIQPLIPSVPTIQSTKTNIHPLNNKSPTPVLLESKIRRTRKNAANAMFTNLSIATHPGLNISRHFHLDLPPSASMAQQSVVINLPTTHYYLQIKPCIAGFMMQRQHKLFVTAGTTRLHAMPTVPGHAVEPRFPLFEARLHPGVNRIEIELVAATPKCSNGPSEIDMEKITVFVNLMKA
ncbi:Bromodomain containing protein [Blumeria hordei DH14]|uniref:Bromodomain containing protein n=1 Tax=Blumeria graminis f. sp. hordei (strain DH14) TaxID=546991 RepID=N1JGK0_BLUG1|nr:Bromodomain containing protein [Blumeria hordei DH14]